MNNSLKPEAVQTLQKYFNGGFFNYERFQDGVADFYDNPACDSSFVVGIGYEMVRCFPEMTKMFLEATKDGEPTAERLKEIYDATFDRSASRG